MNTTVSLEFMFRFFGKIKPAQAEIIKFLIENGNEYTGSFRDLAEALGKPKAQAPNVCAVVHKLEDAGIVAIIQDEKITKYSKTLIGLNADWMSRI